jgi:hypothetical protein
MIRRMDDALRPALRASALALTLVALGGCSGGQFALPLSGPSAPAAPAASAPAVNMAGRWMLNEAGRGQCYMNFGAASAAAGAAVGTIAPEGGCPGKFFTSRKWTFEMGSLVMRDHNGQPLAELAEANGRFDGKATSGEAVSLAR